MNRKLLARLYKSIGRSRMARILVVLLISLVILEVLSKGIVLFALGVSKSHYRTVYEKDPQLKLLTWTERYSPHPYFGYESSHLREAEKILLEDRTNEFVIGILGGSVASGLANYAQRNPDHFETLSEVLPPLVDKKLRIVNLALGGGKQPQQFFIAAYFREKLDLIINLDGWNDTQSSHFLPIYPLDFPTLSSRFYERAGQGGAYGVVGRSARSLYTSLTRLPTQIPDLSRSSFYFLSWSASRNVLYRLIRHCESRYYAKEFGDHQSKSLRTSSPTEIMAKRIIIWKKYTILQNKLVRDVIDIPIVFFLQPNQYLKNSKPFSDEEKRIAFNQRSIEINHKRMMHLKAAAREVRDEAIPMFDLSGIYTDTEETVYIDTCCHVNELGNRIMADAIVSHLNRHFAKNDATEAGE